MKSGPTVVLVLFIVGAAMVVIAAPSIYTEVIAVETADMRTPRSSFGPYDLSRGSYTVWIEDFRDEDEFERWNTYLLDGEEQALWGDNPNEARLETFENRDCELLGVIGNVPSGEYTLVVETADDMNERVDVLLVRSPGTLEGFLVVTGITLVIVAVIVLIITRKRPEGAIHA